MTSRRPPLPGDELTEVCLIIKKITGDLSDGGHESSAVVAQIQNQSPRSLNILHGVVELFLDLRAESGEFDIADSVRQFVNDNSSLIFNIFAHQGDRQIFPIRVDEGDGDSCVTLS